MIAYIILAIAATLGALKVLIQSKLTRSILSNTADFALYNAIVSLGIGIFYLVWTDFSLPNREVLQYAILYSVFSSIFQLMYTIALKNGPVSVSALLCNFSGGITVTFGFLYYHESISELKIIGFVCLIVSLIMSSDLKNAIKQKMSLKWFLATVCASISSGAFTIVTTLYGKKIGTESNATFLGTASFLSCVILLVICGVENLKNRCKVKMTAKNIFAMLSVAVVMSLYLPFMLRGVKIFPSTIYFPLLNASIIALTSISGILLFSDKLKKSQVLGLIFGLFAIILLAI